MLQRLKKFWGALANFATLWTVATIVFPGLSGGTVAVVVGSLVPELPMWAETLILMVVVSLATMVAGLVWAAKVFPKLEGRMGLEHQFARFLDIRLKHTESEVAWLRERVEALERNRTV